MQISSKQYSLRALGLCAGLALAASLVLPFSASAQPGGGGRNQLSAEKREAAWALQAQGVAKELGLSEEQAGKLVEAYKASRESLNTAMREAFAGGGGGGGGGRGAEAMQQMRELNDKERAKLKEQVAAFLDEAQTEQALVSLGTFNRRWDVLVDATANLKLEPEKQQQALQAISTYVVAADKAMREALASGDRAGIRGGGPAAEALDAEMAKLLTPEQMSEWKAATPMRGPGGGPGGPGGGPGRRGPGAGAGQDAAPPAGGAN